MLPLLYVHVSDYIVYTYITFSVDTVYTSLLFILFILFIHIMAQYFSDLHIFLLSIYLCSTTILPPDVLDFLIFYFKLYLVAKRLLYSRAGQRHFVAEGITAVFLFVFNGDKGSLRRVNVENSYRQHGFSPLSMASLQQLDAVDVVANLDQVSHQELGSPSLCPSGYITTAHHVGLCQHCRVECPSVDIYTRG